MDSITVGGKEYKFNPKAKNVIRFAWVAQQEQKMDQLDRESYLVKPELLDKFTEVWNEYCDAIFEQPNEGVKIPNVDYEDIGRIKDGFFAFAAPTLKKLSDGLRTSVISK